MKQKIEELNKKLGSEISMKMEFDNIYRKYIMAFYEKEEVFFKAMGACVCETQDLEDFDEQLIFKIETAYEEKFKTK